MSAVSPEARALPARRVLALVLPDLFCELAEERLLWGLQRASKSLKARPLGVVLVAGTEPKKRATPSGSEVEVEQKQLDATAKLSAVNTSARRYGVREGQSIAEACALVSSLVVREVTH